MNYVLTAIFGLLLWFVIWVGQVKDEQESACVAKGGVIVLTRDKAYLCIDKGALK